MFKILSDIDCCAIIECPPCRRMITVDGILYFLSFPTQLFKIYYYVGDSKAFIYSSSRSFFYDGVFIYDIPLLNIETAGRVCVGDVWINEKSIENLILKYLNFYWKRQFHYEYQSSVSWRSYKDFEIQDLKKWESKTKADVNWIPSEFDLIKSAYQKDLFFMGMKKSV
ncbi:MAG: hypothetical protein EKK64_03035 [Neisseriaceae bacterium]|nr:MAG: hypothetical protein EKK64_03035 [Neisseriaceae bacterium]